MSNLIPEKRLDKNGVLTTKHVRALGKPVASRRQAPAPNLGGVSKKAIKARPKQLEQRRRDFGSNHIIDGDKRLLTGRPTGSSAFTASDAEIYDVLSASSYVNALILLEKGIRTGDEARQYLEKINAGELISDNSALMNEMCVRNIAPEVATDAMLRLEVHRELRPSETDYSANYADTIEFLSISSFENMRGRTAFMQDILQGRISLGDIKAIGVTRLKVYDRLYFLRGILSRKQSGGKDFDVDDMKKFLDKCSDSNLVQGHFKTVIHLFDVSGMDGVDKLDDLKTFSSYFWEEMKNDSEESKALVERALYFAQLSEAIQSSGLEKNGRYWAEGFSKDAELLLSTGVKIEDAMRLMSEGLSAQQVAGVSNGMEAAVADGWL